MDPQYTDWEFQSEYDDDDDFPSELAMEKMNGGCTSSCPFCDGSGIRDGETCISCGGSGWRR